MELGPSNLLIGLSIPASRLSSVDRVPKSNNNLMPWVSVLGHEAQGERRRFEKTRPEPERRMDVGVWSDGFLWVKFLGGRVGAGNLKHGVRVVFLFAMDCVRRHWLSK
jgi:hypothetical protein